MRLGMSLAMAAAAAILLGAGPVQAKHQVYPVGTVKYDPSKAYNSYVLMSSEKTVKLVDRKVIS